MNATLTWQAMLEGARRLAAIVPSNVTGVAGIARKGMLPATVIAELRHLPLGELAEDGCVYWLGAGKRAPLWKPDDSSAQPPLLVVDDGVSPGAPSMTRIVAALERRWQKQPITTAAVWAPASDPQCVDYHAYTYQDGRPLIQEAEMLNVHGACQWASDFDGVLCADPPQGETEDTARWETIFAEAHPLHLPRLAPLAAIVSSRLEKYRAVSEDWLARWGARYRELILCPAGSVAEREDLPLKHGTWKGELYRQHREWRLFIESSRWQAIDIRRIARKPVFCTETMEFLP